MTRGPAIDKQVDPSASNQPLAPAPTSAPSVATGSDRRFSDVGDSGEVPPGLIPTMGGLPSEVIYYQKVLKQPGGSASNDRPDEGALDPLTMVGRGYTKPVLGALVTLEQTWTACGLAFGQLLNSVSLAPGESTRIAVIDWTRRVKGSRQDQTEQIEDLRSIGEQARALSEVSSAVASELQHGTSAQRTNSTSGQAGVTGGLGQWLGFSVGVAGNTGVATSVATTAGRKDVAVDLAQHVQQRTQQHVTSARGRKAAIITETSEQESAVASSRVLTNYNHMHALTIQYFEVVQVYDTKCKAISIDPLLFIPVKLIKFDPVSIEPYISTLMNAAESVDAGPPPTEMGQSWKDCLARYRVFTFVAPAELTAFDSLPSLKEQAPGPTIRWPVLSGRSKYGNTEIDPSTVTLNNPHVRGCSLVGIQVISDATEIFDSIELLNSKPTSLSVLAKDITNGAEKRFAFELGQETCIVIHYSSDRTKWRKIRLRYRIFVPEPAMVLLLDQEVEPPTQAVGGGKGPFAAAVAWTRWTVPTENILVEQHLNRHAMHYSLAVWRASGVSLPEALDAYAYNGAPVLDQIDPQPVAIVGNMLGFRLNDEPEAGSGKEWYGKLKSCVAEAADQTRRIALPTGGVFAEAVLGTSNAAEKLDMTRFWNWQESPIPILPSDIAPLSLDSRARDMDLRPQNMEQALAAFQTFDKLPDPTMGQAAAQALMAKIFDDMSHATEAARTLEASLKQSGEGAQTAGKDSLAAYQASLQHQREMTRLAMDAAKTLLPMVAPETAAAGSIGKILGGGISGVGGGGLGRLPSNVNMSNTGAVLNAAERLDGKAGGLQHAKAVLEGLFGSRVNDVANSKTDGSEFFEFLPAWKNDDEDDSPVVNNPDAEATPPTESH